jgi:hypothetical protein
LCVMTRFQEGLLPVSANVIYSVAHEPQEHPLFLILCSS